MTWGRAVVTELDPIGPTVDEDPVDPDHIAPPNGGFAELANPLVPFGMSLLISPGPEGFLGSTDVHMESKLNDTAFPEAQFLDSECVPWMACGVPIGIYAREILIPADATEVQVYFRFTERNPTRRDEVAQAHLTVNPQTNTWTGTIEWSGRDEGSATIQPNWIGFVDPSENTVSWHFSTDLPPVIPDDARTRLCAKWTGYFDDEAQPGHVEGYVGEPVEGDLRARGYPASFAAYDLRARGPLAQYSASGSLDQEGCTVVPKRALVHRDTNQPSEIDGGAWLHLSLTADLAGTNPNPTTVKYADDSWVTTTLTLNEFDDDAGDWPLDGQWRAPPDEYALAGAGRNHGTTVAAAISHAVKVFAETTVALPMATTSVVVDDGAYAGLRDHRCNPIRDSEGSSSLRVGPGYFKCDPALEAPNKCGTCTSASDTSCVEPPDASECRRPCEHDGDCPGGQFCARGDDVRYGCDGSSCFCAYAGQGSSKFVTMHEFGHVIQSAYAPGVTGGTSYLFDCPQNDPDACSIFGLTTPTNSAGTMLIDPPNMNARCGCPHVRSASNWHCLQSIETTPRAQGEGFAQFFAAKLWNRRDAACVFNYYKEFLDADCKVEDPSGCTPFPGGGTVTLPPVPIQCDRPVKWRNQNECAVDPRAGSTKAEMGTEYDWMTFLYALDGELGFTELMSVFNYACRPEDPAPATGAGCTENVYWLDRVDPATAEYDRGGFLDGAVRKYGMTSAQATAVQRLGNEHGVSEITN